MNRITETLPGALDGERLDRVVALLGDVSRREAVELIGAGEVEVNGGRPDKPSVRLAEGDVVCFEVSARPDGPSADPSIEFAVVHEDDEVIVVDKPAHLVVHPGSGVADGTLVNGLLARFPELIDVGQDGRPGLVHRLDRGTSGLLMVARTGRAYDELVSQLAARTVARRYQTLVHGLVEADEGLIDAPLGRSTRRATRRAVVADGRPARTRYEVERRFAGPELTHLTCRLETGRTHQIRAHLTAIGHPVVADRQYGAPPTDGLDRPFLHAAALGFRHPTTGVSLQFESPLPHDLRGVLDRIDLDPGSPAPLAPRGRR